MIYAILASILWGLNYVFAERLFKQGISPTTLLGLEMIVAGPLQLLFGRNNVLEDISRMNNAKWLVVAAMVTMMFGNYMIGTSIKEMNAALAGLIEISYPIFIVLAAYFLYGENNLTPSVIVGGTMIFLGVGVIYYFKS